MTVKKKKKCRKGKSCGFSCISQTKVCRKNLSEDLTPKLDQKAADLSSKSSSLSTYLSKGKTLTDKFFTKSNIQKISDLNSLIKDKEDQYIKISSDKYDIIKMGAQDGWQTEAKKRGFNVAPSESLFDFKNNVDRQLKGLADELDGPLIERAKLQEKIYNGLVGELKAGRSNVSFDDVFTTKIPPNIYGTTPVEKPIRYVPTVMAKDMKESFSEVAAIAGGTGNLNKILLFLADDRGWATPKLYDSDDLPAINLGFKSDGISIKKIAFHEYGHHLEYNSTSILNASKEFIDGRASSKTPVKLKNLVPEGSFKDDEMAFEGNFIHPYVGKIYDNGFTEVISMGLEQMTDPKSIVKFYMKDPEHFNYIIGVLESNGKA